MTYVIFKTCFMHSSVSLTRGSRVSSRVGALCNLATRLETKNVRQNVTQNVRQNENPDLSFFSKNIGSPGEIRTLVNGSKGHYACPLHHRASQFPTERNLSFSMFLVFRNMPKKNIKKIQLHTSFFACIS